jgi:tetratricopeptide (TPR) repeat protein
MKPGTSVVHGMKRMGAMRPALLFCALLLTGFSPVSPPAVAAAIGEDTVTRAEAVVQARIRAEEKALAAKKAAKEKTRTLAEAKAAAQKRAAEKALAGKKELEEKALAAGKEKLARTETIVAEKVPAAWQKPKTTGKTADSVWPEREEEREVRHLVWLCNEALRNRDLFGARETLETLEQRLPRESLTLLRLRAWYAMSIGEDGKAREFYREILGRIEDDVNSAINLAVLEARAGRAEEARKIILELSGRLPDSVQIQSARQAFGLSP